MIFESVAAFAAIGFTLQAAHNVADHVFGQTDYQAANKAKPGRQGWIANAQHVIEYHTVQMIMLGIVIYLFDMHFSIAGVTLGILFSALSHAFLDRRWPVRWILEKTGSPEFAKMQTPINGMYQADQALHYLCLWISALLFVLL